MQKRAVAFLVGIVSLLIMSCGGSATSTPAPTATTSPRATTAPPLTTAPTAVPPISGSQPGKILSGPLANVDVREPTIQSPRGVSKGTFNIALHYGFAPKWLDAQESIGGLTYNFGYIMHDALIKPMPQGLITYGLAEYLEVTEDFTKAAFRLRKGLTFHDGVPLTTEDVKWNYVNYRGDQAQILHNKLDASRPDGGIEIVDETVIIFHFKEPFVDFVNLYNGSGSGAGWIMPKHYYEKVGPEQFKLAPLGAGPFKFVKQEVGVKLTFEAWDGYWRRVPGAKTLTFQGILEPTLRLAGLQKGEIDMASAMVGGVFSAVRDDPTMSVAPNQTTAFLLFFPGYEDPASPFHDKRVRQAVSLALNRAFLVQQQTQGQGAYSGALRAPEYPDALLSPEEIPFPEESKQKARQLLTDAGYAGGLKIDSLVPFTAYFPAGEQILQDLGAVGITGPLETLEGPAYRAKLDKGRKGYSNRTIVHSIEALAGRVTDWARRNATCSSPNTFICDPFIEERMAQHDSSVDLVKRDRLSKEIQRYILEEFLAVPVYINAFVHAAGPKVIGDINDYFATPLAPFPYPYDDWLVKD